MAAIIPSATFVCRDCSDAIWKVPSSDRRYAVKAMLAQTCASIFQSKKVWIWTEKKEVMMFALERGWDTVIFPPGRRELAAEWSSIGLLTPLFIEEGRICDSEEKQIATITEVSSLEHLEELPFLNEETGIIVVDFLEWKAIPAENIVAAVQGTKKSILAVSRTSAEAQMFLEALEQGLSGVVLKTEDAATILQLKDYLDKRTTEGSLLELTRATVTSIQAVGMGDRACVDLCSLMRPGEGLLVGSFARGLFLVHSECLDSNYIASRPFRVNAGPVHAYVAVPGGKTSYLSELETGKCVMVVNHNGVVRNATVGRVKIETRPLILIEAKTGQGNPQTCSILLQNAETVALVAPAEGNSHRTIPVTSLKLGDEVLVRLQGGARHTGIEIQEFIVEK